MCGIVNIKKFIFNAIRGMWLDIMSTLIILKIMKKKLSFLSLFISTTL